MNGTRAPVAETGTLALQQVASGTMAETLVPLASEIPMVMLASLPKMLVATSATPLAATVVRKDTWLENVLSPRRWVLASIVYVHNLALLCDSCLPQVLTCIQGEDGHSKADCTQPRKFTGTCRECNEEGKSSSQSTLTPC